MRWLEVAANVSGLLGVLLCAGSGGTRLAGMYYIAGFQSMTLFMGGMALLLFSAVLKLEVLIGRSRSRF